MAQLNPLSDLGTFPTTRQTLFDMWANAAFTNVLITDFAEGFIPIVSGSDFSDAADFLQPGQLFFHLTDNVMYCFHDEIEGTGVSLWLAVGPDKFEVACLAGETLKPGQPVQLAYDRIVTGCTDPLMAMGMVQSGINNSKDINIGVLNEAGVTEWGGDTQASGAWVAVGVDGILYGRVENAFSNPSENLGAWTNKTFISLDPDVNLGSLVDAGGINNPFLNPIGLNTEYLSPEDINAGRPSEPAHITKFQFAPRVFRIF